MSRSDYSTSRGRSVRPRSSAQRESVTTDISSVFPSHLDIDTILRLCRPPCIDMLNQFNTYSDEHIRELLSTPSQPPPQHPPYHTPDSIYFHSQREQMDSHLQPSTSATPASTIISPQTTDWPGEPPPGETWSMGHQINPSYGASRGVVRSGYGDSTAPHAFMPSSMTLFSDSTSSGQSLQRHPNTDPNFARASGMIDQNVPNLWHYTNINPTSGAYLDQPPANPVHQPAQQSRQSIASNITGTAQEWRSIDFNDKPSPQKSQGTKMKVPCPELGCEKSYISLPELREHCGAAHDKTRLSTCKHNNCGFRGYRDSIWRHHHTADHKSCQVKSKPEETCMDWSQLWQKQNWGCNVCPNGAFQSAHDWVTHYANHFQHQGKADKDRSFSNLISSLLSQKATEVFWQAQKAQETEPMEWPEAAQQCQNLRRILEEGLYHGRPLSQPDVASMIVSLAVKLANELPHDTVAVKRRATSSPPDSNSSADLRSRRSYQ